MLKPVKFIKKMFLRCFGKDKMYNLDKELKKYRKIASEELSERNKKKGKK
jgi:hypothetical protein